MNKIEQLNKLVSQIQDLDWIEDAWVDDDGAYDGGISVQIRINEEDLESICRELGYNVDDWEEDE